MVRSEFADITAGAHKHWTAMILLYVNYKTYILSLFFIFIHFIFDHYISNISNLRENEYAQNKHLICI